MPRPKGSKNKAKVAIPANDFDTLIAEKSSTKEALVADIAVLEENLTVLAKAYMIDVSYISTRCYT